MENRPVGNHTAEDHPSGVTPGSTELGKRGALRVPGTLRVLEHAMLKRTTVAPPRRTPSPTTTSRS